MPEQRYYVKCGQCYAYFTGQKSKPLRMSSLHYLAEPFETEEEAYATAQKHKLKSFTVELLNVTD